MCFFSVANITTSDRLQIDCNKGLKVPDIYQIQLLEDDNYIYTKWQSQYKTMKYPDLYKYDQKWLEIYKEEYLEINKDIEKYNKIILKARKKLQKKINKRINLHLNKKNI